MSSCLILYWHSAHQQYTGERDDPRGRALIIMKNRLAFTILLISLLLAGCGQRGASPRNTQTDALFRGTIEGNTDMVRSLVSSPGAVVNATNQRGSTPLLDAARYRPEDICRVLKAAGDN